jgi:hypothetical protein
MFNLLNLLIYSIAGTCSTSITEFLFCLAGIIELIATYATLNKEPLSQFAKAC